MKARLINDGSLRILCPNGTIINDPNKEQLYFFLNNFKRAAELKGMENDRWNIEYPDMSMRKGNTLAYITDSLQLVIEDFSPFIKLIEEKETPTLDDYMTVPEAAIYYQKSIEAVKQHCKSGRLQNLKKGRDYLIYKGANWPTDKRTKNIRRIDGRSPLE